MKIGMTAGMTEAERREVQLLNLVSFSLQGKCDLGWYDEIIEKLTAEDVQTDAIRVYLADANFVKAKRYSSEADIYFSRVEAQRAEDLRVLKEEGIGNTEQPISELVKEYSDMTDEYRRVAATAARDALGLFDEIYHDGSVVEYCPNFTNMPETLEEVKKVLSAIVGKAS